MSAKRPPPHENDVRQFRNYRVIGTPCHASGLHTPARALPSVSSPNRTGLGPRRRSFLPTGREDNKPPLLDKRANLRSRNRWSPLQKIPHPLRGRSIHPTCL